MDGQGCAPKQEQSPIRSALGQLENNIDVLSKNLDKLSSMMQPVMRDVEPQAEGAKAGEGQPSEVGQRIQKAAAAISGMKDYVQSLQARIQL